MHLHFSPTEHTIFYSYVYKNNWGDFKIFPTCAYNKLIHDSDKVCIACALESHISY